MKSIRLPRKMKKLYKNKFLEEWKSFLKKKDALKKREKNLNLIFNGNYDNSRKIFHEMINK